MSDDAVVQMVTAWFDAISDCLAARPAALAATSLDLFPESYLQIVFSLIKLVLDIFTLFLFCSLYTHIINKIQNMCNIFWIFLDGVGKNIFNLNLACFERYQELI